MNFVQILRSLEEALYEAMSWLVFYPITLWMVLAHPIRAMTYSDAEQRDKPEQQYLETLSPPLFLVLSLLLIYGLEQALGMQELENASVFGDFVLGSMQNAMVFQALFFSLHPLLYAVVLLRAMNHKIDRESLRAPFFAQCYLAGATAMLVSLGGLGIQHPAPWTDGAGLALIGATTVWYLWAQQRWFVRLDGMSGWKAWLLVTTVFAASAVAMMAILITLAAPVISTAMAAR